MKNIYIIIAIGVVVLVAGGLNAARKFTGKSSGARETVSVQKLYEQARELKKNNELLMAKEILNNIITEHSDFANIEAVQKDLEDVNLNIIFSSIPAPQTVRHEVQPGESLAKIAKKYKTTIELIKKSNALNSDVIRAGKKLRIWTAPFSLFVDKSQNILIVKANDEIIKTYHVSTGEKNSTPVGVFTITSKLVDPVWFNKGVVVPPESPDNVLGTRWLGFAEAPGYGIHGTIDPSTIGRQVTAGCVRMRNEDIEEIYGFAPLGTKVTVVD